MQTRKYSKKTRKTRKQYGGNAINDYQIQMAIDILGKLRDAKERIDTKYDEIKTQLDTLTFTPFIRGILESTSDVELDERANNELAYTYGKVLEELPASLEEFCASVRRLREFTNAFPQKAYDLPDKKPASRPAYITQRLNI